MEKEFGTNIQEKYAYLFKHSCYCFCLCYKFSGTNDEWKWLEYISKGVQKGYITEDCFVGKPLLFINNILGGSIKDVVKVEILSKSDIPTEPTIVEMKSPSGGSHFVVCHRKGNEIVLDFDPSFMSNSWKSQEFISYRKYI